MRQRINSAVAPELPKLAKSVFLYMEQMATSWQSALSWKQIATTMPAIDGLPLDAREAGLVLKALGDKPNLCRIAMQPDGDYIITITGGWLD